MSKKRKKARRGYYRADAEQILRVLIHRYDRTELMLIKAANWMRGKDTYFKPFPQQGELDGLNAKFKAALEDARYVVKEIEGHDDDRAREP